MIQCLVEIHSRTIFASSFRKTKSTMVLYARLCDYELCCFFCLLRSSQQKIFRRHFLHLLLGWRVNKHLCVINLFWCFVSFNHYRGANYNLLKHNCNTFSEDLCQFLCGTSIPKYILDLPQEILSTPIGQSLAPLIGKHSDQAEASVEKLIFFAYTFRTS